MKAREFGKLLRDLRLISQGGVRTDEPMSRHTTVGVGGPAKIFALPRSVGEVDRLIRFARSNELDYVVIGRGSNLLVRDGGFNGMVIKIGGYLSKIRVNERTAYAQAGASLSLLSRKITHLGRPGLEFAIGIPGSVGGAVRMNAGAYGHHIGEVLSRVRLVDRFGRILVLKAAAIPFDYRNSHLPRGAVVLSATFHCPPGRINRTLLRKSLRRGKTQPLSSRSFGSTFVNPPSSYAGKLIESCGLKGKRIGGAVISRKHANFILNVGSRTRASDIEDLINLARHEVKKKLGIMLKPEVVIIGDR